MAEKVEDLNLPALTVQKIIKEALPNNINVGKDARSALSRAASVFVLYVTSQAAKEAQTASRKTLLAQDVLKALEELEFSEFLEPCEVLLKEVKETKSKKVKTVKQTATGEEVVEYNEEVADEEDDIAET